MSKLSETDAILRLLSSVDKKLEEQQEQIGEYLDAVSELEDRLEARFPTLFMSDEDKALHDAAEKEKSSARVSAAMAAGLGVVADSIALSKARKWISDATFRNANLDYIPHPDMLARVFLGEAEALGGAA